MGAGTGRYGVLQHADPACVWWRERADTAACVLDSLYWRRCPACAASLAYFAGISGARGNAAGRRVDGTPAFSCCLACGLAGDLVNGFISSRKPVAKEASGGAMRGSAQSHLVSGPYSVRYRTNIFI